MPGSKRTLILQDRDRRLLKELVSMRVADREQAELVAGFRSKSRSSERLLRLTRSGFLKRTFTGSVAKGCKAVYTLGRRGAIAIDADTQGLRFSTSGGPGSQIFLEHQLTINEVYLAAKYRGIPLPGIRFRRWVTFREPISKTIPIKPDGYFELDTPQGIRAVFVEVDLGSESTKVWEQKVERYVLLATSGIFTEQFRLSQFRILALTTTEKRLQNLRAATASKTDKLFFFTPLGDVRTRGLFAPIWQRPTGTIRVQPI